MFISNTKRLYHTTDLSFSDNLLTVTE